MTASRASRSTAPATPSPDQEGAPPAAETPAPARPAKHAKAKAKDRIETYEVERPDGVRLKVVRNVETGEATYTAL